MSFAVGQRPEPSAEDVYLANFLSVCKMAHAAAPFWWNDPGGMIWEPCEYRDMMSSAGPVIGKFRCARRGRTHFRREILGDVKNFHVKVKVIAEPKVESNRMWAEAEDFAQLLSGWLIVNELECRLVQQRASTVHTAPSVVLPALCDVGEFLLIRQAMHDAQLHDMQSVIERAGDHG